MAALVPRRTVGWMALVTALALTAAACSSGDAVRPTSAADELPKDAKDREIVESGTLRITDFSAGWSTDLKEDDPDNEMEEVQKSIPECVKLDQIDDAASLGQAESADFVTVQDAQASNTVEIYPDAARAEELQALVRSPDSTACLQKGLTIALERALTKDPETAAVVRGITVTPGPIIESGEYGDATATLGFHAAVDIGGTVINLYFDVVVVRVGRTQAGYMFQDDLPEPAAADRPQLIQASVDRLRAAGA